MTTAETTAAPFAENVFGHLQRVKWLRDHLRPSDRVLEFGCGTGVFITLPLLQWGYDVIGVDLDPKSIEYGRRALADTGFDPNRLSTTDARDLPGEFDAIIASEVFEHLTDDELREVLGIVHSKLVPGGRLLVTVPHGYGWFELESFLWYRCGLERAYERFVRGSRVGDALKRAKRSVAPDWGGSEEYRPMTLAPTPHLERFTWRSLRRTLERAGFAIRDARGAVLVCGPVTDLALSGFPRIVRANKWLGERLSPIASDFYVAAEKR